MGRWGDGEKKKAEGAEGAEGAEEEKLLIASSASPASRASPALFYAPSPMPNPHLFNSELRIVLSSSPKISSQLS